MVMRSCVPDCDYIFFIILILVIRPYDFNYIYGYILVILWIHTCDFSMLFSAIFMNNVYEYILVICLKGLLKQKINIVTLLWSCPA